MPDVGEIEVQGHQDPSLSSADFCDARIRSSPETFLAHAVSVVAGSAKQIADLLRQILIDLKKSPVGRHYTAPGTIGITRSRASSAA